MPGACRIEIQTLAGGGKVSASGLAPREAVKVAFDYFKANSGRVSASIKPGEHDFHLSGGAAAHRHPGSADPGRVPSLCAQVRSPAGQNQMVVMGDMSLGGTVVQVPQSRAESLQVAFDAGAKRILLPMSSVTDIPSVPGELFAKFQTSFTGSGGCGVQGVGVE